MTGEMQVSGDVDAFIEKLSVIDVKRINNNLTLTEWRTLARAYVAEYRESAIAAERAASDRLREALAALWPFVQSYVNDHLSPQSTAHAMAQGWITQAREILEAIQPEVGK